MVDKIDWISVMLYAVVAVLLVLLYLVLGSNVLQPGLGVSIIFYVLLIFPFVYPAYWAFDIRRALAVPLYRRQAFGIALMCLVYVVAAFDTTGYAYGFFVLFVFYWIDTSFSAARRSDPLVRDSLHWTRLRIPLWFLSAGGIVIGTLAALPGFSSVTSNSLAGALFSLAFFIIPGSGVALAVVVNRRTSDYALKRQIAWLATFVFVQFASIFFASSVTSLNGFVYFFGLEFAGFCLYKSVKSLAPLNRLSFESPEAVKMIGALAPLKPRLGSP